MFRSRSKTPGQLRGTVGAIRRRPAPGQPRPLLPLIQLATRVLTVPGRDHMVALRSRDSPHRVLRWRWPRRRFVCFLLNHVLLRPRIISHVRNPFRGPQTSLRLRHPCRDRCIPLTVPSMTPELPKPGIHMSEGVPISQENNHRP